MKRVYTAESLIDATLLAEWLEGCGVPCEVFNQNSVGALGELPYSTPEVWIRRDLDEDKAEQLITEYDRPKAEGEKRCRDCSEKNPMHFDICWNCQQPLPIYFGSD